MEIKLLNKTLQKIEKIESEIAQGTKYLSITRLLILKKLCKDNLAKCSFALYLTEKTYQSYIQEKMPNKEIESYIEKSLKLMKDIISKSKESTTFSISTSNKNKLNDYHTTLLISQNNTRKGPFGIQIRSIHSMPLYITEIALSCFINDDEKLGYEIAKNYTEKYNCNYGTGLIPESLPYIRDIVKFWVDYHKINISKQNILENKRRKNINLIEIIENIEDFRLRKFIIDYLKKDKIFKRNFISNFKKDIDNNCES